MVIQSTRPSTFEQVKKIRIKLRELGLPPLSKNRESRLRKMSFDDVSHYIDELELRVSETGNVTTRERLDGMASNRALFHLFNLRDLAHDPVKGDERISLMAASVDEVQTATQAAQKALQDYNDAHGVPLPQWRFLRGLYDPETRDRNGIAGVAKSKHSMTPDEVDALHKALSAQHKQPDLSRTESPGVSNLS